jgi:hypothetical protein
MLVSDATEDSTEAISILASGSRNIKAQHPPLGFAETPEWIKE